MSEEKEFWRKGCFAIGIWIGIPFISFLLIPQITGKSTIPLNFAYFGFPAIVLILTDRVFMIYAFIIALLSVFSKKLRTKFGNRKEPNKFYGLAAIPIALILYGTLGWLCSWFWPEEGPYLIRIHSIIGLVWGCCVYILYQTKIFGDWDEI